MKSPNPFRAFLILAIAAVAALFAPTPQAGGAPDPAGVMLIELASASPQPAVLQVVAAEPAADLGPQLQLTAHAALYALAKDDVDDDEELLPARLDFLSNRYWHLHDAPASPTRSAWMHYPQAGSADIPQLRLCSLPAASSGLALRL